MRSKKVCLMLLAVLFVFPTLYSQPEIIKSSFLSKRINNFINFQQTHGTLPNSIEKISSQNDYIVEKYITETNKIVESVIHVLASGERFRESYTYNSNGSIISYENDLWDFTKWTDHQRFRIEYDNNGNRTCHFSEVWKDSQWVDSTKNTYEYDSNNNLISAINEIWDGTQWITEYRETSVYNESGKLISADAELLGLILHITRDYNSEGNLHSEIYIFKMGDIVLSNQRITYTYDSNNILVFESIEDMDNDQWVISAQIRLEYDSNNNRTLYFRETWDKNDSTWTNDLQYLYEYDANDNNTLSLYENWSVSDSQWVSTRRHTYEYDNIGNRLLDLRENADSTQWNNYTQYTYGYDGDGDIITAAYEKWIDDEWTPNNGSFEFSNPNDDVINFNFTACLIEDVVYATLTDIADNVVLTTEYSLLQNYPNPFNPTTTISYSIPENGLVKLKVYDALGGEVATLVNENQSWGTHKVNFNATGLSSGVYFYRIDCGKYSSTKKLILLR